jgi:LmbE family N-acetylglucosaminyl deacetylase
VGEESNGIGQLVRIGSIAIPVLAILGAVFYVGFQSQANSAAIARLELRNDRIEEVLRDAQSKVGQQTDALTEIETQFCASDIVRNLMHANDMRTIALLWQKTFPGSVMPTDNAYYPTICNRKTSP